MKDAVVLITGALSGIGAATAIAFAREGAHVVVSGRHDEKGHELVATLQRMETEAVYLRADVRREEEVRQLVENTKSLFDRIDVAVNSAGIASKAVPLPEQTLDNYAAIFDTNVLGMMLSLKHELRIMQAQGSGSIVNVSSIAGHVGFPGASVYVASKHAVEGLTKTAALEAAAMGVRVNAVAPGFIDTDMLNRTLATADAKAALAARTPVKRLGHAEEIAQAILFLASDKVPFLTGATLVVDGGIMASP